MQPLAGFRIADFSHVMAGPYASHLLTLLGAEVIKIEPQGMGDPMRNYGADRRYDGMSPAFIAVNAGKKSIALDLKNPDQLAVARDIVSRSDVLLENFRPGVMARLGLGYEAVKELREDIIYCSVSGYGQSGPLCNWPAIDNIVQATCGMMSLGGDPEDPPMRVGFPVVDTLTGQTAAFAIVAALLRRQREGTGEYLDVAMYDAAMAFMTSAVVPFLVTGKALKRTGNVGYSGQPTSALFTAGDGRLISLGVVQQHQFVKLANLLDRRQWLNDERFSSPEQRRLNAPDIQAELTSVLATDSAAQWEKRLSEAGIPCGMVREVGEAASMAHLDEREALIPLTVPGLPGNERVKVVNAGFRMMKDGPGVSRPPPRLGADAESILQWLGYDQHTIDNLDLPEQNLGPARTEG
jgi:crotonobetainyl-CoA:carnitine CoA-transferase CaiB-like acyl-CoA transferase